MSSRAWSGIHLSFYAYVGEPSNLTPRLILGLVLLAYSVRTAVDPGSGPGKTVEGAVCLF